MEAQTHFCDDEAFLSNVDVCLVFRPADIRVDKWVYILYNTELEAFIFIELIFLVRSVRLNCLHVIYKHELCNLHELWSFLWMSFFYFYWRNRRFFKNQKPFLVSSEIDTIEQRWILPYWEVLFTFKNFLITFVSCIPVHFCAKEPDSWRFHNDSLSFSTCITESSGRRLYRSIGQSSRIAYVIQELVDPVREERRSSVLQYVVLKPIEWTMNYTWNNYVHVSKCSYY